MKRSLLILMMTWVTSNLMAATGTGPLLDNSWVKHNGCQPGFVLLDIRSKKIDGQSKPDYLKAHIPCAVHTDYIKGGWREKRAGVPGMLPPVAKLEALIGKLGIDNDTHVVLIPFGKHAKSMGSATRLYWTFKVMGHDKVSILNGGHTAYSKQKGNRLDTGNYVLAAKTFKARTRKEMIVSKQEVQTAMTKEVPLVDNRSPDQFLGINRHPKAKKNGTIPGASNLPFTWLTVNNSGNFRSKVGLREAYRIKDVPAQGEQITLCNTGHLGSLGWFVGSELLGNKQARLYDGSMSEWSRDSDLSVERKITMRN